MNKQEAIEVLKERYLTCVGIGLDNHANRVNEAIDMAIEALSAEAVPPQSEQYKKGFEDAKKAFLVEYARESESMRKRNAELEVMLNAQKAISAEERTGEWIVYPLKDEGRVELECSECGNTVIGAISYKPNFCENCGAIMESEKLAMQRR